MVPLFDMSDAEDEQETSSPTEKASDKGSAGGRKSSKRSKSRRGKGRGAKASAPRSDDSDVPQPPRKEGDQVDPPIPRSIRMRGALIATVGLGSSFLMMANEEQLPHGPLWGMIATLVGAIGVVDLLGLWSVGREGALALRETALFPKEGEPLWMSPLVTVPAAIAVFAGGAVIGGYDGLPVTVLLALSVLFISGLRRPWVLVVCAAGALFLPFLGAFGLWDPWETHYGEVAREILARDDWISLWWAQEDWFWSKPILIFWIEALSMGAHGTAFLADANPAHPEWAIRFPHFLLVLGALSAVYGLVARVWSKRTGLVACLVLATMPHFFFLAHQAITDMPFVACMTMAICMLGIALTSDPDQEARTYAWGPITFGARQALVLGLTVLVLPQVLYLISRNVTFTPDFPPFGWHGDMFLSGSAGNSGVPGNSALRNVEPAFPGIAAQPFAQALIWLAGYVGILWLTRRESRVRGLAMLAFYVFCALAFMAKGIPGFALPGLVALFYLLSSRRWDLLLDGSLRVGPGVLTVATVGLPWYVAMYIRHGPPFTNRLLVHDHINRLTAGVHGDNSSIEYFIEQLGYGLFPWIAFTPLALAAWFGWRRQPGADAADTSRLRTQRDVLMMIGLWMAAAFTLFSAMTTKFHHYIFPAVPPTAILVGVAIDRLLKPANPDRMGTRIVATALAVLAPTPAVLGIAGLWGDVRGIIPADLEGPTTDWVMEHAWDSATCYGLVAASAVLFAAGAWLILREHADNDPRAMWWTRGALTTGLLAGPPVLALVGRDLSWVTDARPQGYERLIHLFVYNYGRPWPDELDYRPILTGFAIVATSIVLLAAIRPLRDIATRAFIGVSLLFCLWSLDVYIVDLSPHWGQRELVQRYYAERSSAEEPLIAWQMNWKGENFYTGNHVHVFVQLDNQALREWVSSNPGRTVFFLLEHARLASLRGVLRGAEIEELTDTRLCNKFVLIRARLAGGAPSRLD